MRFEKIKWATGFKWSNGEKEFFRKNYSNLGAVECAKQLGRTVVSLHCQARKMGIRVSKVLLAKNISIRQVGEGNSNWKINPMRPIQTGRKRAKSLFKETKPCVVCGCEKSERHHKDGNTLNNSLENIAFLCRKHHMQEDERIKNLKQYAN